MLLVDGYDTLRIAARSRLRRLSRRAGGLVVTAHRRTAFRTLIRCRTSVSLLGAIVQRLLEAEPAPASRPVVSRRMIEAMHRRHGGDLRAAIRELYDHVGSSRPAWTCVMGRDGGVIGSLRSGQTTIPADGETVRPMASNE